jgi:hypothetical protein
MEEKRKKAKKDGLSEPLMITLEKEMLIGWWDYFNQIVEIEVRYSNDELKMAREAYSKARTIATMGLAEMQSKLF